MTASSQNPPGALPPETPPTPPYATAAAIAPAAPAPVSPLQVTAGVVRAAMANTPGSPEDIAQALQDTGVTIDPKRAQEIWDDAYKQAKAEYAAKVAEGSQTRDWFHARCLAVGRLCEDRDLNDTLKVGEVLTAVDGRTPTVLPLTIRWDGTVTGPAGDGPGETTLIAGMTARGGRAVMVLDDDQRLQLGERLLATLHTAEQCRTHGCGTPADQWDASDPSLWGWIRVQVGGVDGDRWWCNRWCANAAITAAEPELRADDQAAAVDPHAQAPGVPLAAHVAAGIAEDPEADARCERCGCTENNACAGGCYWVPNRQLIDLCSACATPAEFAAAGYQAETGGAL